MYASGSRLAKHEPANATAPVAWYITEPLTGDWGEAKSNGDFIGDRGANLDPLGAETPPNDPYLLDPTPTYIESRPNEPLYIDGGDPFDLSGGCEIDGLPRSCSEVQRLAASGSLQGQVVIGGANIGNPRTVNLLLGGGFYLPAAGTGITISDAYGVLDSIATSIDDLPLFVGAGVGLTGGQQGSGQQRQLMQDQQGGKLTPKQCDVLTELLKREEKYGTRQAARLSSANSRAVGLPTPLGDITPTTVGSDYLLLPFDTTDTPNIRLADGREFDLDWFTVILQNSVIDPTGWYGWSTPGLIQHYSLYVLGKGLWTSSRKADGIPVGNPHPFQDPGERNALKEIYKGSHYRDLFTPDFFKKFCSN